MKFKIKLKEGECSTESNITACRINLEPSKQNKYEFLKASIIRKFQSYGISDDNFDVYWEDSDRDFIIIADNDDLSLALEEMSGPLYELIALLKTKDNVGMFYCSYFFLVHYSSFNYTWKSSYKLVNFFYYRNWECFPFDTFNHQINCWYREVW